MECLRSLLSIDAKRADAAKHDRQAGLLLSPVVAGNLWHVHHNENPHPLVAPAGLWRALTCKGATT
jgi:hypothetical protein